MAQEASRRRGGGRDADHHGLWGSAGTRRGPFSAGPFPAGAPRPLPGGDGPVGDLSVGDAPEAVLEFPAGGADQQPERDPVQVELGAKLLVQKAQVVPTQGFGALVAPHHEGRRPRFQLRHVLEADGCVLVPRGRMQPLHGLEPAVQQARRDTGSPAVVGAQNHRQHAAHARTRDGGGGDDGDLAVPGQELGELRRDRGPEHGQARVQQVGLVGHNDERPSLVQHPPCKAQLEAPHLERGPVQDQNHDGGEAEGVEGGVDAPLLEQQLRGLVRTRQRGQSMQA
mmetsp:Transcript_17879/g.40971  ORF Transcript_17879/g.40971 Transcript_17879/m.40971 type:complete len:283 (-) Transcript_17879:340-1188(-)